ncbi:helix-turn-helix domain-containing protein [Pseudomonas chlororaphis]|uniref:helix-turn-helix domain-containing protein n=1 Tax=Pseudomonas chlororaphis TaxID=587753 RepID=UPI001F345137|nr:helix-turn-helix transcriptional regulator [Pseudomonas chlororaphis]
MELRESFGATVKAIRRSKGLPQDAVGINQGYVSELENGLPPSLPKVDAIAKNLGIHPLTLLTAAYSTMGLEDADCSGQAPRCVLSQLTISDRQAPKGRSPLHQRYLFLQEGISRADWYHRFDDPWGKRCRVRCGHSVRPSSGDGASFH